jgi:F-type H+-transporting ATPase subunit epsilon
MVRVIPQSLKDQSGMTLSVQVVTPGGVVWNAIAQEVILPSTTGHLGVLSGHIPLMTFIDTGVMRIRTGQDWMAIAVMNGFAQVRADEVTVIVNGAECGDRIDRQIAQADVEAATERVSLAESRRDRIKANTALKRARARLQAAQT